MKSDVELRDAPAGKPAFVKEDADRCLKVVDTGPSMVDVTEEPDITFFQHLRSYGGSGFGTTYAHLMASNEYQKPYQREHWCQ